MIVYANTLAVLGVALLFLGGLAILGVATLVWTRTILLAQQARSNHIALTANEEVVRASSAAVDEIAANRAFDRHGPPDATDDELARFARLQSEMGIPDDLTAEAYHTTGDNEMRLNLNGEAEIPRDTLYAE